MIDISNWLDVFLYNLKEEFGERIWFVGLQGSYARDEATEKSDIDIVVILDEISIVDIKKYNKLLDKLPNRDLICGFISGKKEIFNWEPSDLFQFYYDTKPIKGSIDELLNLIDSKDIDRAIKNGACNIYHACVHNMLYEKNENILRELYKSASFVIQAIYFKQNGKYIAKKKDLIQRLEYDERVIMENFLESKKSKSIDFESMSENLFDWSRKWIKNK